MADSASVQRTIDTILSFYCLILSYGYARKHVWIFFGYMQISPSGKYSVKNTEMALFRWEEINRMMTMRGENGL